MKITIELTEAEVKALRAYLKDTASELGHRVTKDEIKTEVRSFVDGAMQSGALGDYFQKYYNS